MTRLHDMICFRIIQTYLLEQNSGMMTSEQSDQIKVSGECCNTQCTVQKYES